MRRVRRLLAIAVPTVLAVVPVALAGAEPASGGPEPSSAARASAPADAASPARATATSTGDTAFSRGAILSADAASSARAALAEARTPAPATVVRVRAGRSVALHVGPGRGGIAVRLGATTEFGSPRALGVVRRRGRWLGVTTAALPNGELGWVRAGDPAIALSRTRWSIVADLSSRRVALRRDGRVVRRLTVAVGTPGSPTPTGRFAVTDLLDGGDYGPYYGCCVLALSATQPNTPPGWTGGNRMAIHGTDSPGTIGAAASAGCLRAGDADLRFLTARVPLGTPVVIRR